MTHLAHAATTLLLRDAAAGPEVFLLQRHGRSPFMPGAWVFPGGKLDPQDHDPALLARCVGLSPAEALDQLRPRGERLPEDLPLSPHEALGLHVAALRELFEEAGVLLCAQETANAYNIDLDGLRGALAHGEGAWAALLEGAGLRLDLGALSYVAHWLTPPVEARRFNTRFFVARMPPGQEARHDDHEAVASGWWAPAAAVAAYRSGELLLAPPTLYLLASMEGYAEREALLEALLRAPLPSVLPRLAQGDEGPILALPGDPLAPAAVGMGGPTRLALRQGQWWVEAAH
jgi:8-oxo-dGTP pyrophosphatase MutT (NUDIX family)